MVRSFAARRLIPVAGLVAALGCNRGPAVYPVEGRVVYADDTPVPGRASVTFHQEHDGKPYTASGRIMPDGTFRLTAVTGGDGALAGENGVSLSPVAGAEEDTGGVTVGPKYGTAGTSGLKVTVEPGLNRPVLKIDRPEKGKR
jgi:hypothetical protein